VPDGRTKMELAAEGVVGALTLLNEKDEVSVHMVDTGVHELFPIRVALAPWCEAQEGLSGGAPSTPKRGLATQLRGPTTRLPSSPPSARGLPEGMPPHEPRIRTLAQQVLNTPSPRPWRTGGSPPSRPAPRVRRGLACEHLQEGSPHVAVHTLVSFHGP
jgi:hypothetical protein